MDIATQGMIETLDKRIAKLQDIRRLLLEEFGGTSGQEKQLKAGGGKRRVVPPLRGKTTDEKPRKTQIHEWLKIHGPATRGEILKGTQFPGGTVGSLLSQCPDLFESREGKWYAR